MKTAIAAGDLHRAISMDVPAPRLRDNPVREIQIQPIAISGRIRPIQIDRHVRLRLVRQVDKPRHCVVGRREEKEQCDVFLE